MDLIQFTLSFLSSPLVGVLSIHSLLLAIASAVYSPLPERLAVIHKKIVSQKTHLQKILAMSFIMKIVDMLP